MHGEKREGGWGRQTGRQAGRQAGGREGMKESRNKVQQIPVIIMLSMPASIYYSINIFYYTSETMLELIKHGIM